MHYLMSYIVLTIVTYSIEYDKRLYQPLNIQKTTVSYEDLTELTYHDYRKISDISAPNHKT